MWFRMALGATLLACPAAWAQDPEPIEDEEPIDTSPPWEAAPEAVPLPAPVLSGPVLPPPGPDWKRYHQHQRTALIGVPFYIAGVSMTTWAGWQRFVLEAPQAGISLVLLAGVPLAAAGGGAIAWGGYSAVNTIFDGSPPGRHVLAGRLAYGMLGIGTALLVADLVVPFGDADGWVAMAGLGGITAAGLPGLVQTALNPHIRAHASSTVLTVLPRTGGATLALRGRL